MAELARRPMVYRALVLSLNSLFREELAMIPAVKHRFPQVEIWLCHTDGRQATMAEAMRLGADGLVGEDTLLRTATGVPAAGNDEAPPVLAHPPTPAQATQIMQAPDELTSGGPEPVLTAEELRALLQEQPTASDGAEEP
jgi:hypothetical protein